jgi:hypothetical protein
MSGLGGTDGAISIDMVNFQEFSMDNSTWQATIGAGTLLEQVTTRLHDNGRRAIAHGTCPGVGIGGHATIVSSYVQYFALLLLTVVHIGWSRSHVTDVGFYT